MNAITPTAPTSKPYIVPDEQNLPLNDFLSSYGYLLRQPGGWRWLKGLIADSQLDHARRVIEARYGTTTPEPVEQERRPIRKKVSA